ncbi:glycoside hydrolase family 3 N-terminal domain-containing protein [Bacteroides sp. 51]|uniref:glycoside hydrolase family 3 N-terminal domain-containing protein n=1 Tax=Bacteroides sp. 51 TaxID=2302938 RepID=UPI0013D295A2|nr:glycoside hydrolase family 3 N-terminal domain-containing protein [Bacteroides sp. 51]NDV80470.1 glycosyl hydrolase [Bacteroides sp. 51]
MKTKKAICAILPFLFLSASILAQDDTQWNTKADSILSLMTLDEKVGQLNMLTGNWEATGPVLTDINKAESLKQGRIGSMLNVKGSKNTRELQSLALQSRLGIPVLFGQDVIHGYKTIFPIPLAQAASFDPEVIGRAARVSARESAVSGIHWVFSPMLDVSRDPRWGRVMEGPGEDPFLASAIAKAMIEGYQTPFDDGLSVMACAKHFAAYSGAIGGRDYNTVDVSLQTLHNLYLPPFKVAAECGIASFMSAFNEINGIPATAHPYIYNLLYKDWNFDGIVVSDWGAIREMVVHGYSKDRKQATEQAFNTGITIDMESNCYSNYLKELVEEGRVTEATLDRAVKQVLIWKMKLGLFDDPYKYCDEKREGEEILSAASRETARDVARKSIILLENKNAILPIVNMPRDIAVIGSLANSKRDMDGNWVSLSNESIAVTLLEALKQRYPASNITFIAGYSTSADDRSGFGEAIEAARKADLTLIALGETWNMSGEARSKGDINIPSIQQELATEIYEVTPHAVTLIMGGRPTIFNELSEKSPAILYCWWLGTEAGNAILDVVTGEYNPSARVPMSFPKHLGQIPVYYNHKNTGRPPVESDRNYSGRYIDMDHKPRYPFGFGLSYSEFEYTNFQTEVKPGRLVVSLNLTNTGLYDGAELVQVYVRKLWGPSTRPVKELKGFRQVFLKKGTSQSVQIEIPFSDLSYYEADGWSDAEGDYKVFIGRNATDIIFEAPLTLSGCKGL